jgi:hypothetical protein
MKNNLLSGVKCHGRLTGVCMIFFDGSEYEWVELIFLDSKQIERDDPTKNLSAKKR